MDTIPETGKTVKTGSKAPAFVLDTDNADTLHLKNLEGRIVVLYFYPKDNTPGCTRQAIAFSGKAEEFARENAVIVGVSRDSVEKHGKFRSRHNLDIILGSDEDGRVVRQYGVWVEKSMFGKKYMGIERTTFLVDTGGIIRHIWRKVKVPGHAEAVLEAVRKI